MSCPLYTPDNVKFMLNSQWFLHSPWMLEADNKATIVPYILKGSTATTMTAMKKNSTLLLCFLLFSSTQAQKVELGLNLLEGEKYTQVSESKISINQVMNGQNLDIDMAVKGSISYLVRSVNEANYELEMMYESLSMKIEHPQGTMEFDSEKRDENDVLSTVLSWITGKPITVILTKKGSVSEVREMDTIWASVFDHFTKVPETQLNQVKSQIKEAYGEEALKANIEMVTAIFPDHKVEVGDKWTVHTTMESGMTVNVTTTYKLEEIHAEYYMIKGDSKLQTADKEAIVDANGMSMKYDLSGQITSKIKINKQSGWIIRADHNQDIKGEAHIQASPVMPVGMIIPMTMKNETVITNN